MKHTNNISLTNIISGWAKQTTRHLKAILAAGLSLALPLTTSAPFVAVQAQARETMQITTAPSTQDNERGRTVRSFRAESDNNSRATIAQTQGNNLSRIAPAQTQPVPTWARAAVQKSLAHLAQKPDVLRGSDAARDLRLHSVNEDNLGQTHVRLAQLHHNIEVFGGQIITHLSEREEPVVSGRLFAVNEADATPSIAAEQAIQFAKDALAYAGNFAAEPTAKLVVLPNSIAKNDETEGATLTWQVELRIQDGTEATAHHQYFIGANNGQVMWHYNSLPQIGVGESLYHGRVRVPTSYDYGRYVLAANGTIFLMNSQNTTDLAGAPPFSNDTNVFGDGTMNNPETAAVDVAYGLTQTLNYFKNIHGRNGFDGRGTQLRAYVHYGQNVNNAYAGGGQVIFGDGDGSSQNPYVALDIVGHEFTHNVIEHTANLTYANESGALNESFADIFGLATKFYDDYKPNYLYGDGVPVGGGGHRYFRTPEKYGQPAHYSRLFRGDADNGYVHYNSGISNHAFYLLAEGGTHAYSRVQVPGIGHYAAERIFYRALSEYLTPSSQFIDARFATTRAAADLYGYQSPEWHATHRAWDAVGVGYNRFDLVQNAMGNSLALTGPSGWGTMPTVRRGTLGTAFSVTNYGVSDFAVWAADPAVRKVTGDFNGDGLTDIALIRSNHWYTMPVAFANGSGGFNVTNYGVGDFARYSGQGATILTGDFNGDGRTDIAMTGGSGWNTLPVAFSNGNGTFVVTNQYVGSFAQWATEGATAIAADFNGDGKTDVALTGPGHWNTMPVAYSIGTGSFSVTNPYVGDFAKWAAQGAKKLVGDFNRDGKADVALTGVEGWQTLPVAYGATGGFQVINAGVSREFADWASLVNTQIVTGDFNGDRYTDVGLLVNTGEILIARPQIDGSFAVTRGEGFNAEWLTHTPQLVAGDFNNDGKTDLGLTGVSTWNSLPMAFSNGNGTFFLTNDYVSNFAAWSATNANSSGRAIVLTGNFRSLR